MLNPGPGRMATITAEEETTAIAVTRAELLEGLAADPRAAIALLEILAGRFRETALRTEAQPTRSRRGCCSLAAVQSISGSSASHGVR